MKFAKLTIALAGALSLAACAALEDVARDAGVSEPFVQAGSVVGQAACDANDQARAAAFDLSDAFAILCGAANPQAAGFLAEDAERVTETCFRDDVVANLGETDTYRKACAARTAGK